MHNRFGLQKCRFEAVALPPVKEELKAEDLEKVYGRLTSKETDKIVYYVQEFKIAWADEEYTDVLELLRNDKYKIRNIFFKDIDVIMDYADSFDGEGVKRYLTRNKGFGLSKVVRKMRTEQY